MIFTKLKMKGNVNLSTELPVFDDKNWNRWMIQMCVLFVAQDVLDLVNDSYILVALTENVTDAQRNAQCDLRKKDHKALFYIRQCVDVNVFEKIIDSTTMEVVWDTLVWCYDDDASVKKVRL